MSNLVKFKHSPNWYVRFQYEGTNYQKSLKTTNKRLAQQLADKYFEEVIAGLHNLGDQHITIGEAITSYVKTRPNDKNEHDRARFFMNWLPLQDTVKLNDNIQDINNSVLEKIVEIRRSEGKKEGTTQQAIGFIGRVINWASKNGYAVNSIEVPKIKVKNTRLRYLSIAEEERLLSELNPNRREDMPDDYKHKSFYQDNYDLTVILLDTGARLTEITTLKWHNVNLKDGTISLYRQKVGNESILHMTDRVKAILTRRYKSKICDYIFTDSIDGFKKSFCGIRAAIKRAGIIDCTIHTFRHTCASRLIQNGMQLYEVAAILGHSDISMTQRYAHIAHQEVSKKARDVLNGPVVADYNLPGSYTISSSKKGELDQQNSVLGDITLEKSGLKLSIK